MCFFHDDCDWHASVSEVTERTASLGSKLKCGECYRSILPGEIYHHIYQQELDYGECRTCAQGDCDCSEGKCCACGEVDVGETFDFDYCRQCHLFLAAVEAAEIEAGCHRNEARPSLGGMMEEIGHSDAFRQDAKRYWKKAMQLSPELRSYLAKLWSRMFCR